jgi:outer membrane protein OmpA-like peptidoglycan-associated protein
MGWLPWLIGALLLAALAFLLLRSCKGCGNTPAATIPAADTMTSAAMPAAPADTLMKEAEAPTPDPNAATPVPACDFSSVKLTEKIGTMANFLAAAGPGSQQFSLDGSFGKGSARLPAAMSSSLEGVATLAKMCESFTIEVYGNMAAGEKATVAGSKELTLTDARADAVVAKLRALGVPQGRVQAVGQGTGTSASAEIVLKKQ